MAKHVVLKVVFGIAVILAAIATVRWLSPLPALKDGDLVFQTSRSAQSDAILGASLNLYSHVGIVRLTPEGPVVIEAVGPVRETPLRAWIARGRFHRVAVYRVKDLDGAQAAKVFRAAHALHGRPYDPYFSFERSQIYCSELVYDAFAGAGRPLGRVQKLGELAVSYGPAKSLIAQRAAHDPECLAAHDSAAACHARILQRPLVTPKGLTRDPNVRRVYSNYPF